MTTTTTDPDIRDVRADEITDLIAKLADEGKTVLRIEVSERGRLYKCHIGPWPPRQGTFPDHSRKRP
jgi:hypothetical protein